MNASKQITAEMLQERIDLLEAAGYKRIAGEYEDSRLAEYLLPYDSMPRVNHRYHPAPHEVKISFADTKSKVHVHLIVKSPKYASDATIYQALVNNTSSTWGDGDYRTTSMKDIKKVIIKANRLRNELNEAHANRMSANERITINNTTALEVLRQVFGADAIINVVSQSCHRDAQLSSSIEVSYKGFNTTYSSYIQRDATAGVYKAFAFKIIGKQMYGKTASEVKILIDTISSMIGEEA